MEHYPNISLCHIFLVVLKGFSSRAARRDHSAAHRPFGGGLSRKLGENPGQSVLGRPAYSCSAAAATAAAVKSLDGESDDDLVAPAPSLSHNMTVV